MFNVTFSFALADVPFHFIPKIFWEKDKNIRRLSFFWLTGYIEFSNDRTIRSGRDMYYQLPLTILCDSYTKSSEIVDIVNENDSIDVFFEKISDYMEKNELGNQEKDENGLHIICDAPELNYWQQNQLKNKLTREILADQEKEKREGKKNDAASKFYFTE
ncbi:MAG: hypothetical protein E7199_06140 [Schwartzia succinivorans]|nr:hypothetical protein [Schwartzia succinivorans]